MTRQRDDIYRITPLEEHHARDILEWRYPTPYDFYNPPDDENGDEYVRLFLKPEFQFHAVLDDEENFVGFCSYGIDGQVPGGDYRQEALDIGVGMKPELTGQGRGPAFFRTVLDYATSNISPGRMRLTVAKFNERALRQYDHFGFIPDGEFSDSQYEVPYTILVKEATAG